MTTNVVDTEWGPWRPISERIPEFLQRFPPDEGWGVEIEMVDPLSRRPGLLELYKECIRAGRTARSLPDPNDPAWKNVVFIAKLTKDGQPLITASTVQFIEFEHDYEKAETRARDRLMAACGFGGNVLDFDNEGAPASPGRPISPTMPSTTAEMDDGFADDESDPDPTRDLSNEAPSSVVVPKPDSKSDIPAHIQAQVDAHAATLSEKGEEFEMPTSKTEALKFLRRRNTGNGVSP